MERFEVRLLAPKEWAVPSWKSSHSLSYCGESDKAAQESHIPSICTRANSRWSIVLSAGMAGMMSEMVTRGLANKSKPLIGRKYHQGGSVWGIRDDDDDDDAQEGNG